MVRFLGMLVISSISYIFIYKSNNMNWEYISGFFDADGHITLSSMKKIKLVLEKYKSLTPRNGKYTDNMLKMREKFINEFFSL